MLKRIREKILDKWFRNTLYVRFRSDWMSVRMIEKNLSFEGKPVVALKFDKRKKTANIAGAACEAERLYAEDSENIIIANGLEHPRSFFRDTEITGVTIQRFFLNALNKKRFRDARFINLTTIIHPLEKIEGGITQAEFESLVRLSESVIGSRKTYGKWCRGSDEYHSVPCPPTGRISFITTYTAPPTYVWTGRELTNYELVNLDFPTNDGKLGWCDTPPEKEMNITDSESSFLGGL